MAAVLTDQRGIHGLSRGRVEAFTLSQILTEKSC